MDLPVSINACLIGVTQCLPLALIFQIRAFRQALPVPATEISVQC